MQINIGTIESNCAGFDQIASVAVKANGVCRDSVEFNLASCRFFEANMAAPFYSVIARLRNELNDVTITNMPIGVSKILRKNKFMRVFNQSDLVDINNTTLPFRIFKLTTDDQIIEYLETYMKGRGIPAMSEALSKRFKQSLLEIFVNSTIHSQSEAGVFVCGQYYPAKHRLDFSVADAGIGIRENVRSFIGNPRLDSCEAIRWAMKKGNTTRTANQPGGLGLDLIKSFVQLNGGKILVVSRYGFYQFHNGNEEIVEMVNDFPGTCVNIEFNTKDESSYVLKSELESNEL